MALKDSSNLENFWMMATKHTKGKHLNLAQADTWETSLFGVVVEMSLKQKCPEAIGEKIGITDENVIQHAHQDMSTGDSRRTKPENELLSMKRGKKVKKILNASKVMKEEKKSEWYQSGKVPLVLVGTEYKSNCKHTKKTRQMYM